MNGYEEKPTLTRSGVLKDETVSLARADVDTGGLRKLAGAQPKKFCLREIKTENALRLLNLRDE